MSGAAPLPPPCTPIVPRPAIPTRARPDLTLPLDPGSSSEGAASPFLYRGVIHAAREKPFQNAQPGGAERVPGAAWPPRLASLAQHVSGFGVARPPQNPVPCRGGTLCCEGAVRIAPSSRGGSDGFCPRGLSAPTAQPSSVWPVRLAPLLWADPRSELGHACHPPRTGFCAAPRRLLGAALLSTF